MTEIHTYRGATSVVIFKEDMNSLSATIETGRLRLKSVKDKEKYYQRYISLFTDPLVMDKFLGGVRTVPDIKNRIKNLWAKRWNEKDPYSAFAVFKKDTKEFVGHAVIGYGDDLGEASIAFAFLKDYWKQGFGTEVATALVKDYGPATVKAGYLMKFKDKPGDPVQEVALDRIHATARLDNTYSLKILEKLMDKVGVTVERQVFSVPLKEFPSVEKVTP